MESEKKETSIAVSGGFQESGDGVAVYDSIGFDGNRFVDIESIASLLRCGEEKLRISIMSEAAQQQ
jgi:hypothetical protein